MSLRGSALLDLRHLSSEQILELFHLARRIQKEGWEFLFSPKPKLVALVFLEPSTRTTMSFEVAAAHLGMKSFKLQSEGSSTKKGETLEDTLLTLNAMRFDLFVVRHGTDEKLADIVPLLEAPVINAGEGTFGHPTQALLDLFTIASERGQLQNEKILIVGDVVRSRVAASFVEILQKFGLEVGFSGPKEWMRSISGVRYFESLEEGLKWSSVVQPLRIQKERFALDADPTAAEWDFVDRYQLNERTLQWLPKDGLILHPGPFNRGVEISAEVLSDPRSRIWEEVENGVSLRGALMAKILGVIP